MSKKTLNKNLHQAKNAKKDDFYTQLPDIERELKHFYKYFATNFNTLEIKKLITTSYVKPPNVGG